MRSLLPLPAVLLVLAACGRDLDPPGPEGDTITPRAFAAVVTELAVARATILPDTAAYRARMTQILAMHQLTEEDLRAFARGYGGNEDVLFPVYELERTRLDSLFGGIAPGAQPGAMPGAVAPEAAPPGMTPGAIQPPAPGAIQPPPAIQPPTPGTLRLPMPGIIQPPSTAAPETVRPAPPPAPGDTAAGG